MYLVTIPAQPNSGELPVRFIVSDLNKIPSQYHYFIVEFIENVDIDV